MQEILKKLQELVSLCETRLTKMDAQRDALRRQKEGQDLKDQDLTKREETVRSGEKKYKEVGDLVAYRAGAQSMMNRARAESDQLTRDKDAFERHKVDTYADIENEKAIIQKRNKEIADAQAALDKREATYKKKVTDEIMAKLGKR